MKYLALSLSLLSSLFTVHLHAESLLENQQALENALKLAQQKQLASHITWKRLLYAEDVIQVISLLKMVDRTPKMK